MAEPTEYEQTLTKRARRLGMSLSELLEHDRKMFRAPGGYPRPNCFFPHVYQDKDLVEMLVHVLECPMCAALVLVSRPNAPDASKT